MTEDAVAALALVLMVVGVVAGLATWLLVAAYRRSVVTSSSAALAELRRLNDQHRPLLAYLPPLRYDFVDRVSSKARYDRYDLGTFFLASIGSIETDVRRNIDARLHDSAIYGEYAVQYDQLATQLGRTTSDVLQPARYERIERKQYLKQKLPQPALSAQVRCTVAYTSPQGKNHYARALEWDFSGLCRGIEEVRQIRESRSTTQFLRQQERNKMTTALRAQILRRDRSQCRMCGAAATDGIKLHVDHIMPVSKGGLTTAENLQTLCQDCNLGKSNHL